MPAEPALKTLAASIGVQGNGLEDLVHSKAVQDEVFKQLAAVGRKASLANIELIQGVVLSDEEWTPQNVSRDTSLQIKLINLVDGYSHPEVKSTPNFDQI